MGYWNKVRRDFPEVFERMAQAEQDRGPSAKMFTRKNKDGVKVRISLRELPPNVGRYEDEDEIECGVLCQMKERSLAKKESPNA